MSEKSKNILLGVLIVGLVSMTVAYAALSTSLTINGQATVEATKWDIHFAHVDVDRTNTTSGLTYSLGTLDDAIDATKSIGTAITGMSATLNKPGDKLVVNFDIVNAGTIDAKVSSFAKHISKDSAAATSGNTNDVVTYTITCGEGGNQNETLAKNGGSTSCTLTVQYDNNAVGGVGQQASTAAGTDQTVNQPQKVFNFDAAWTYIQP